MGVARTVGQDLKKVKFENIYLMNMGQLAIYNHKMFIRLLNFIEFIILYVDMNFWAHCLIFIYTVGHLRNIFTFQAS